MIVAADFGSFTFKSKHNAKFQADEMGRKKLRSKVLSLGKMSGNDIGGPNSCRVTFFEVQIHTQ